MLADADRVLRWAIWDVRRRDLPADIAAVLERIAPAFPRAADPHQPRTRRYTEGAFHLSVFPDNTGKRELFDSFPVSPGCTLDEVLAAEPAYVLVTNMARLDELEGLAA